MIEFSLLGDIAFSGLLSEQPKKNQERFKEVAPILQQFDLVFANLEVPVKVDNNINEHKNIIHYSLPEATRHLLKLLNIGCVSLANNHIYDCNMAGLKATINLLDDLGIYHTGAGWKKEHIEPVIINNNGTRIGFLAYVDTTTNPGTINYPELLINYFEVEGVITKITKLKDHVDKLICSIHWGNDYSNFYTIKQKQLAHQIIDSGADIIMGHHPHTVQPYEIYNNGVIFYSLGQLCFGDLIFQGELRSLKRKTKLGIIVSLNGEVASNFNIISTKEKKGNTIIISKTNIILLLKIYSLINNLKIKYKLVDLLVRFKEAFIDRIYEFIFGYYRYPFKDFLDISNLKKFGYMARDFRSKK